MTLSTIIIPVYNQRESFLRAAVASALTQTVPVEVVVIDDGSDWSIEPILRDVYDHLKTDSSLICIRQENGGVASALNAGIKEASGEFIQWLSSDDIFCCDKTEKQAALLSAGEPISYCAYEEGIPQPQTVWAAAQYPSQEVFFDLLKKHCFVNACTVMWHRDVFEEVGLFDPGHKHAQDYEMLLRCAERWNFVALNEPLVRRRVHPGQMINTLKDPDEAEGKRVEMEKLGERYGCTKQAWVPAND